MDSCYGDYKAMASKKAQGKPSDCVSTPEFFRQTQDKIKENQSRVIQAFASEMGVGIVTVKLSLNENLRYYSHKRCKAQTLTAKAKENRLTKAERFLNKLRHPVDLGDDLILFR